MPRPRKNLVCVEDTPYYHVTSRCVRRAFLCGVDSATGKSFEHRRQWVEDRIRVLSSVFCIELCAYAIMSNHYHLVVRLSPDEATGWPDDEVFRRWTLLYRGPLLVQRYRDGEALTAAELDTLRSIAAVFRQRLTSLSWFMKCLNEPIARAANREDGCTGHFWEARFYSQALRSDRALLAAMAYVDLNPVRAGIASRPETSEYTSIQLRTSQDHGEKTLQAAPDDDGTLDTDVSIRPLAAFATANEKPVGATLPIRLSEYLKLVDITGRFACSGKRGRIDTTLPPILDRLGMSTDEWIDASSAFRKHYRAGDLRKAS